MKKNIGLSFCNMSSQDRICPIVYSKLEAVANHSILPLLIIEYIAPNMIKHLASNKRRLIQRKGSCNYGVFTLTETDKMACIKLYGCVHIALRHQCYCLPRPFYRSQSWYLSLLVRTLPYHLDGRYQRHPL